MKNKNIKKFKEFESHHYQSYYELEKNNDNDDLKGKDPKSKIIGVLFDSEKKDYKKFNKFYKKYPFFIDKFLDKFDSHRIYYDKVSSKIDDKYGNLSFDDPEYLNKEHKYVLDLLDMENSDNVPNMETFFEFLMFLQDTYGWGGNLRNRKY